MKKVIILGSKPNAKISDGDCVYCANASISDYGEEIKKFARVVNVVSGGVLDIRKINEDYSEKEYFRKKWDAIVGSKPDRLLITKPYAFEELKKRLYNTDYTAPVEMISALQRRLIIKDISGLEDPIFSWEFLSLSREQQYMYMKYYWRNKRRRRQNYEFDCDGIFRPSTGVVAAVLAVREYGQQAEYIIAGVGVVNRGAYVNRHFIHSGKLHAHVFPDGKVLKALAKKYLFFTTEPELTRYLPNYSKG